MTQGKLRIVSIGMGALLLTVTPWQQAFCAEPQAVVQIQKAVPHASTRTDLPVFETDSSTPLLSSNGNFLVFTSHRSTLANVPAPRNVPQVYRKDLRTGVIELVSIAQDNTAAGNAGSLGAAISDDGALILFESEATNLTPNLVNRQAQVFLRDMRSSKTQLVSVGPGGLEGARAAVIAEYMSGDGTMVLFSTTAINLPVASTATANRLYLRAISQAQTTLLTEGESGRALAYDGLTLPNKAVLSENGALVAFEWRNATPLLPEDTNSRADIYLRDLVHGTNILGSVDTPGTIGNGNATNPSLSTDGRYLAFLSTAKNFGDPLWTNSQPCLYRRDLTTGLTERVSDPSLATNGVQTDYSMSATGDLVAFVANQTLYLWDASTKVTRTLSTTATGETAQGAFESLQFSHDGSKLICAAKVPNLLPNEANLGWQIYAFEAPSWGPLRLSTPIDTNSPQPADCHNPCPSGDGNTVAFVARGITSANAGTAEVLVRTMTSPWCTAASAQPTGTGFTTPNRLPVPSCVTVPLGLSRDGARLLIATTDPSIVTNKTSTDFDIVLCNLVTGQNILVSASTNGLSGGNAGSPAGVLSADGRHAVFISLASNLLPGDTNNVDDAFWIDLDTGVKQRIDRPATTSAPLPINEASLYLSEDGTTASLAFRETTGLFVWNSSIQTLAPLPSAGLPTNLKTPDVILGTLAAGKLLRWYGTNAFTADLNKQTNQLLARARYSAAISPDGRYLFAANPGATGYTIQRLDLLSGTNVQHQFPATGVPNLTLHHHRFSPSSDGRSVAFVLMVTNSIQGVAGRNAQVAVAEFPDHGPATDPAITIISLNRAGQPAHGDSWFPSMSADGRFIVYTSLADDLVPGDTNNTQDILLHDRFSGETRMLSLTPSGQPASGHSTTPLWSNARSAALFLSAANDLVPDDTYPAPADLFLGSLVALNSLDTDNDGLPDLWERHYFGDLTATPDGDEDNDGFSNLAEYRLGWNPASTNNAPQLAVLDRDVGGTTITLGWFAPSNAAFRMEATLELDAAPWQPANASIVHGADPSDYPWKAVVQLPVPPTTLFFRLVGTYQITPATTP